MSRPMTNPKAEFAIRVADLNEPALKKLLMEHVSELRETSPPESCHVLELDELRRKSVTVFAAYDAAEIVGCAALKRLDPEHGELKSMRTAVAARGRGVGKALVTALEAEAVRQGLSRLSLETGTQDFFAPARALYQRCGYVECPPFGSYGEDPLSVFMTRGL
jgi:putative acetyltransferase